MPQSKVSSDHTSSSIWGTIMVLAIELELATRKIKDLTPTCFVPVLKIILLNCVTLFLADLQTPRLGAGILS